MCTQDVAPVALKRLLPRRSIERAHKRLAIHRFADLRVANLHQGRDATGVALQHGCLFEKRIASDRPSFESVEAVNQLLELPPPDGRFFLSPIAVRAGSWRRIGDLYILNRK